MLKKPGWGEAAPGKNRDLKNNNSAPVGPQPTGALLLFISLTEAYLFKTANPAKPAQGERRSPGWFLVSNC
jgi:hypothetical protein